MIDSVEKMLWEAEYLRQAMDVARPRGAAQIRELAKWARSMSLIAEQFYPNEGDELVDAP